MGKLQESLFGKSVAVLLLLISAFCSGLFACRAFILLPMVTSSAWQYTTYFQTLLEQRQYQVVSYFSLTQDLEDPDLSYMDRRQLQDSLDQLKQTLDSQSTWFRYQVRSSDGSAVLASNLPEGTELNQVVPTVYYASFTPGESTLSHSVMVYEEYSTDTTISVYPEDITDVSSLPPVVIECGIDRNVDLSIPDEFSLLVNEYTNAEQNFPVYITLSAISLGIWVITLLFLLWSSGHKAGYEGIFLSWQDRIISEVYFLIISSLVALLLYGAVLLADYFSLYLYNFYPMQDSDLWLFFAAAAVLVCLLSLMLVLFLRTITVRLKAHSLAKTTLLCVIFSWIWRALRDFFLYLPLSWRTAVAFLGYLLIKALFPSLFGFYNPIPHAILNILVLLALCRWTVCLSRLRQGSQAIAAGNLNHQIDTSRMPHDLRALGEDINNISDGLAGAVNEKKKSVRFKAELFTKVSHDLKTPLTSIINYVNLLKTTQQTDPKAQEYIEVLDRKSQRLKKLTEDLVEASKASTGVLSVNREKIGMAQLIDQALGEWTEKLEERHLSVVSTIPEGETWVYADGRHLWRVIDNLLSNCAKYAMEGTRVYLDLVRGRGQVTLSVKNISREALNIPPERLMERFVRGDESRTTEGSGLGLSIARSLTELQGGTFELTVDGDLFKASVTLPQAN